MGLLSYYATLPNQNVVHGGTAHMYPVQERLYRSQASNVAMQFLREGMAHLCVSADHPDCPDRLTVL